MRVGCRTGAGGQSSNMRINTRSRLVAREKRRWGRRNSQQECDPNGIHDLEGRLREVIAHRDEEERQAKAPQRRSVPKRLDYITVAGYQEDREKTNANPAKVQVRLYVAVMRLVWMKAVLAPEVIEPRPQPEALEAGSNQRIELQVEHVGPYVGPSCQ